MGSLIFSFLKRAVLIPVLVAVAVIAGIRLVVPGLVAKSNTAPISINSSLDLSAYSTKKYKSFSKLESEDYIGSISSADFGLGATPVLYCSQSKYALTASEKSEEPWKGGATVLYSSAVIGTLKSFYDADIGDVIDFDFFSNGVYSYKIKSITIENGLKDLSKYYKKDTLAVCVAYNDFDNLGDSFHYVVYSAELISAEG